MTKRETGTMAFRIFSLYVFYNVLINQLVFLWPLLFQWPDIKAISQNWLLAGYLTSIILQLALGIIMWIKADKLAEYLVSGPDTPSSPSALSIQDIQTVAFTIIGLFLITQAFSSIVPIIVEYYSSLPAKGTINTYPFPIRSLAGFLVELIIGIYLLFGSRGLVGLLEKLRNAGKKPDG